MNLIKLIIPRNYALCFILILNLVIASQVPSLCQTPPASTKIVGSDIGESSPAQQLEPDLVQAGLSPANSITPLPSQLDNYNPIMHLHPKRSKMIESSISGVAIVHGNTIFDNSPQDKGMEWGPYWLIDGDQEIDERNVNYSSGLHLTADADEWAEVKLEESHEIDRIVLYPRIHGTNFPSDFQILISTDGQNWQTVANEKNDIDVHDNSPQVFTFPVVPCQYIRVNATKLTPGSRNDYYFQLQEIRAYSAGSAVDWALASEGATATASNPLTGNWNFHYKEYYDNIFDSGVKWLLVTDDQALLDFKNHNTHTHPEVNANLQYLQQNGVNVIYRFQFFPTTAELKANPDEAAQEFVNTIAGVVSHLKGKVAVWAIGNEQNFGQRAKYGPDFPNVYAALIIQAAKKIRELDPSSRIEIETALYDFDWMRQILNDGVGSYIDQIGVHVYKEQKSADTMPEVAGTFISQGQRHFENEQPYKNNAEEAAAYKKLLASYNPKLQLWMTETAVNTGLGGQDVSLDSQAKYLARCYVGNYILGIGPTCWWSLEPQKTGTSEWGLLDMNGKRKPAWYALQNVSSTIDSSYAQKKAPQYVNFAGERNGLIYSLFEGTKGDYLIPYWYQVPMRDANTGVTLDVRFHGLKIRSAEAVDMLTGTTQKLNFQKQKDRSIVFKNIIARDYPIFIWINPL